MRNVDDIMKGLPAKRRAKIEEAVRRKVAAVQLQQAREGQGVTQEELATKLHMTQPALSRFERRPDVRVSKLARYVHAMGGELEITATFPGGGAKRAKKVRLFTAGAGA